MHGKNNGVLGTEADRQPLSFTGRYDGVPAGRARREVTDLVMNAIQKLSGQQFAGVYNERPVE